MTSLLTTGETPDVPSQVFESFLEALRDTNVSPEVIDKLRRTLLEDKKYTERALKEAVLSEVPRT